MCKADESMLFIWDSPAGQASFIASKVFSISSAKKFNLSGDDLSRAFRRGEGLAVFPAQALDLEVCHDF
ncbi:MAG: hypothetical protein IKO65_04235 [Victivallales bacterium]|nr:hypothetical protein [Victivallales bacterium]